MRTSRWFTCGRWGGDAMDREELACLWSRVASDFDEIGPSFFGASGRRLVELAGIAPGARVLDVATGRGAALLPAAERAGRSGCAVGTDFSAGMVRATAAQARHDRAGNIHLAQAEAERLPFACGSFDAILCGHAIFYFPAAAAEFYRVLLPDGIVGLSIVERECHRWLWEAWAAHVPSDPSEDDPGGAAIDSPDGLGAALREAGFCKVRVVEEATTLVYASKGEWWATLWALGTRHALEQMSPGAQRALRRDLFERLDGFCQADRVHVPYRILYALGRKGYVGAGE